LQDYKINKDIKTRPERVFFIAFGKLQNSRPVYFDSFLLHHFFCFAKFPPSKTGVVVGYSNSFSLLADHSYKYGQPFFFIKHCISLSGLAKNS
jgi:hypothetical protein